MKKILLGVSLIAMMSMANADSIIVQTPTPKKTPPTVQMPPSDPNAGDASAYTLPGDGLTSPADNADLGNTYEQMVGGTDNRRKSAPLPEPRPDQNSY